MGSRSFRLPPAAVSNTFFFYHLCCLFNRFLRFCLAMEIDTPAAACWASLSRCLLLKIVSSCQRQLQQQPHRCCQCASVGGRWPTKSRNTNTSNKKKKKTNLTTLPVSGVDGVKCTSNFPQLTKERKMNMFLTLIFITFLC